MLRAVTGATTPEEVERLKEEVAELQSKLDRRERRRRALRRSALSFLLVLGCGLVAMSLVAAFVRATVLNTDRYVDTMAPIARSPAVQQAVADKLDIAITNRVDFDAILREALPPRADPLAPALAGGLRTAIRSRLDTFVASDDFANLWDDANRRAHTRVVALLTTGESKRLLLDGDTVYLDLGPAVARVRSALEDRGLDRLAAAIPPDVDGRVTLLQSEAFVKARKGIDLLEGLVIVLPILALLCLAGHVALSRPRRRGLLRVGLGLIATALLLLALVGLGRSAYLDAINQNVLPREAAADIFDALIALLRDGLRVVAIVAVVVALVALVLGRADVVAERSRSTLRGVASSRGAGWVAEHRTLLQGIAVALGALVLLSWDPPTAGLVLIDAALVLGAVALIAAIAGVTSRGRDVAAAPPASRASSTPAQ
jgi:multisubunit Na+/H+ antiporter MnhB subunit